MPLSMDAVGAMTPPMLPRVYDIDSRCAATSASYTHRSIITSPVASSRRRICTTGLPPANTSSTLSSTLCATQKSRSCISIRIGNVGGAWRSMMVFWHPRARASSSPSVTLCTPPTRSDSVGFLMRFSRSWPCAVPMRVTPRSAIVRHAAASSSVPISSTMMISGVWFSTASIITRCCCEGSGTCMRRAPPMAGCGTSPSPPISLLVSMITTRLP
mmetsp:Transcript_10336/g.43999  ORF Transcript_10336/g.43999 Transcript_10336/m.43999 type:complete len:215 (+) Transcript_10336:866-1510(+)